MNIICPDNHTRMCGVEQGYNGLPIRDDLVRCSLTNGKVFEANGMVTAWRPTEEERARLLAGEDIYIRILGRVPAPMAVGVGDPLTYGW